MGCYVTKSAPHLAPKLIASGKLTFGERVVLHLVARHTRGNPSPHHTHHPPQENQLEEWQHLISFCRLNPEGLVCRGNQLWLWFASGGWWPLGKPFTPRAGKPWGGGFPAVPDCKTFSFSLARACARSLSLSRSICGPLKLGRANLYRTGVMMTMMNLYESYNVAP